MGGSFLFECFPQPFLSKNAVSELYEQAQKVALDFEDKFTDYRPSPFNEINKYAGKKPVEVDREIFELIKKSLEISENSKGVFDISYASYGHFWREQSQKQQDSKACEVDKEFNRPDLRKLVNYKNIKLCRINKTVYLPYEKMRIGMGGIGKGRAVDKVFEYLKKNGLINFMVNGSGDIRMHSHSEAPRPWRIGISNPFSALASDSDKIAGLVQLRNGSVSTSGGYVRFNRISHNVHDNHIYKAYKKQQQDLISCTILGDECLETDVNGTISMALGKSDALSYLNAKNLIGILIDSLGESHLTQQAQKRFGIT